MMTYMAGGIQRKHHISRVNPNDRKDNQDNIMMFFTANEERQAVNGTTNANIQKWNLWSTQMN